MKLQKITMAAAAGIFAAMAGVPAIAADVDLRFAHWLPERHALHQTGFKAWAESLAKATDGGVQTSFFPAQQLGAAKDHYDMARDGIADITWINVGYQPGRFPIVAVGELPFLIDNAKQGSAALDSWYRPHAAKEMGDVHYCMVHLHAPGTLHSKNEVTSPEHISGMNIRPANGTLARWVNMLGGASVQVAAPEAREALAKGTADAIFFPHGSIYTFGIDSITKYHIDYPMYVTVFAIVMNKNTYEGLSSDHKAAVDQHCTSEWAQRISEGWADHEEAGQAKFEAADDHRLVDLSDAQKEAWRASAEPLREAWAADVKKAGQDPDALLSDLRKTLSAANSLVQ